MAIYFYPDPVPATPNFLVKFWCDRPETVVPSGQQDSTAQAHNASCEECASYGGALVDGDHQWPQISISYGNASLIMGMLGYKGDDVHYGEVTAEDFLGRLLIADGLLETTDAREPVVSRGAKGATLIDLGLPAGYVNDRIRILISLAQWAKDHNTGLRWY